MGLKWDWQDKSFSLRSRAEEEEGGELTDKTERRWDPVKTKEVPCNISSILSWCSHIHFPKKPPKKLCFQLYLHMLYYKLNACEISQKNPLCWLFLQSFCIYTWTLTCSSFAPRHLFGPWCFCAELVLVCVGGKGERSYGYHLMDSPVKEPQSGWDNQAESACRRSTDNWA